MKILQSSVFRAICAIAIGILLIKYPDNTVTWITIAIGILFLLSGIISLVVYYHALKNVSEYKITDAEGNVVAGDTKPTFPIVGVGSAILGLILALTPTVFVKALMYIIGAVLVLGAVILAIAYAMQIQERKREFATLRILGVSRKQLSAGILKEIAVVCLAGGAAGALLGMLVMIPFSGALQGWLNMPMLMPGIVHCFLYLAGAVFLCLAGAMPACLWSVWKVSRAEISDSLREEK